MYRTHNCVQLNIKDINKEVILCGWVHSRRDHGGLIFIDLRDREGLTQLVFNPEDNKDMHEKAHALRSEFVICVKGKVSKRPPGTENPKIPTGSIEILCNSLEILNTAKALPFEINDDQEIGEDLRLAYRFLDLRRIRMQKNIILRSHVFKIMRDFLDSKGFLEIETPILTKSTPEGARDYLVPSRLNPGCFYALPQSPQLFKQILMVSGFDKYYQIARCFRDEDLRKDRQPEFTQLDIEMSFIDEDAIFSLIENLMFDIFDKALGKKLSIPFTRLTHKQALLRYGTDKPDLRYGMELLVLDEIVSKSEFLVFKKVIQSGGKVIGIKAPQAASFSLKELEDLTNFTISCGAKGLVWIKITDAGFQSPVKKHLGEELLQKIAKMFKADKGDIIFIVADQAKIATQALGQLRVDLAQRLKKDDGHRFEFLWVTDFPLFQYNEEEKRWDSEHHPFTAPKQEDIKFLEGDLACIRSRAYDLVVNGMELGSGSIRIHQPQLQKKIFEILGMSDEQAQAKFGFLTKSFDYGAPPHGGIAPGIDRLLALITNSTSIREVIAFPKNQKGICPLTQAPSSVSPNQLKELHLTMEE